MPRSDLLRNVAEAKGANGKADVALTPFPSPADGIMLARGRIWVKQQKKGGREIHNLKMFMQQGIQNSTTTGT